MNWLIKSAFCALMPATGDLPGIESMDLDSFLATYKRETNTISWVGLVAGVLIFTVTPLFTVGLPVPSPMLSKARLDTHASRLTSTRIYVIRQSTFVVKMVAGLCWAADPRVRAHFNLEPYPEDPQTWRAS